MKLKKVGQFFEAFDRWDVGNCQEIQKVNKMKKNHFEQNKKFPIFECMPSLLRFVFKMNILGRVHLAGCK